MISPLKYKPVNWVDGMKLSSSHFVATDQFNQDFVRDANSISLNNFNYGLLPPFAGERVSHDIEISEKATNHIEIKVRHCNAITAEGCRIDIPNTSNYDNQLSYSQFFSNENTDYSKVSIYNILLLVNPFDRVPAGTPDPQDNPPRYPDISKKYSISILPASEMTPNATDNYHLTIGQFVLENGRISINTNYIPPSSSIVSHPGLIRYYESFSTLINDLQLAAFKIIDKTAARDSITPLGKNIRLLSEKMLDYIAQIFFNYRNLGYQQSPVYIVGYCSNLAHVFFTGIKLIEPKEREEMLKYFYEWRDVTPGNFEELLARNIEMIYDHQNIQASMSTIEEFLKVMVALWNKLSMLEYIGQRKENIVVAEQQMVQQVQTKRTWTLLD
ncbi:hypothetical protein [Pedobacter cryoconitis]|uniref:Type VI secretion system baseplate subunit TssK n=1 Tax=Pedobacter cryoconitis TaxID=188932 RepID=A0A327SED5_9SPHI|nr:hypothetical protein [Pedobacter cryoconitis]RAJ26023.1 hypothetical protein LY11_03956 [Pedobacter cryoconitis]